MRLKKKYRNLLRFIAVTLILILMISVVAAAKQHIDNKKSNHNQDIEEEYPDEDAEAYELPERTLNSDVIPYDGVPRTISCWGDSMMFGMGAGEAYIVFGDDEPFDISGWTSPDTLQYLTGIKVYNLGVSGETSYEIALRQGGIKMYVRDTFEVGYDDSVDVTIVDENGGEVYMADFSAFKMLSPEGTRWHYFRWVAYAGNYLLMMFYTMVAGWMLNYFVYSLTGQLSGKNVEQIGGEFNNMLSTPSVMIFWTLVVVVISILVCSLGLQKGVEKISKVMMILLFALMIIMAVNSLLLDGSSEGLKFYLVPDFSKMKEQGIGNVVFAAMSHAFFTLGLGIGSMEIFGSYLSRDCKLTGESINVVILDTVVALTAGIIIIPACFAYGINPGAGPSLLFITLPNVSGTLLLYTV
jgi:hypothetical protein